MTRIVLQFAGLWLGASGVLCYAQWNGPTFGNTYRVAQADLPLPPAPAPAEMAPMDAPAMQESILTAPPAEAGVPTPAGPIGYEGAGYGYAGAGYGGTFGGETCCDPMDPCVGTLWDGYWGAKHHWCQKSHGCGCGHHGLLPQLNWAGGCCSHRACWGAGGVGHGCGGHGCGLFGGHGFGAHGAACCEEPVVEDCGCEPCADSCCGHHGFLPQLNWVGGCCSHRACFGSGVVGHGHGMGEHGLLSGHGHHGVGVMDAGCSTCGN